MSMIPKEDLNTLNEEVLKAGYIDRVHLLKFLEMIPTSDGQVIVKETEDWLQGLHDNPVYGNIAFDGQDIAAVLGDLASYGRVQPETVLKFHEESNRNMIHDN